jgi:lipid-A-disaccharide synthase
MADARLFFSAGDTSGDQHAARLLARLRELRPGLQAEGLGGPALAASGCTLHEDLVQHAIIGLRGAAAAVPHMLDVLARADAALAARPPDAVILVDYPGLNLHVARLAHRRGLPVVYFVAPQLWAWAPWRVRRFARVVDEALVIFPFEVPFFERAGLRATWIGHPLLDGLPQQPPPGAAAIARLPRPVALLPGSRPREVREHMPLLLAAARRLRERFPDSSFHAAHVSPAELANMAGHARAAGVELSLHGGDVHAVMAGCRAAAVASGTATLETALFGTPLVVVYRISRIERALSRVLLVTELVGQVNLVAGRRVCPELLVVDEDPAPLVEALAPLLEDTPEFRAQREALAALRQRYAGRGAVERAAQQLLPRLRGAGGARVSAGQRR